MAMVQESSSIRGLMESEAYETQKMSLQKAINTDVSKGGDVVILNINYEEFKHLEEEKSRLYALKMAWRDEMKIKWGPTWTKRGASRTYEEFHHRMN